MPRLGSVLSLPSSVQDTIGTAFGIKESSVRGGSGDDRIFASASNTTFSDSTAYGGFKAEVNGGSGADVIELRAAGIG